MQPSQYPLPQFRGGAMPPGIATYAGPNVPPYQQPLPPQMLATPYLATVPGLTPAQQQHLIAQQQYLAAARGGYPLAPPLYGRGSSCPGRGFTAEQTAQLNRQMQGTMPHPGVAAAPYPAPGVLAAYPAPSAMRAYPPVVQRELPGS